MKNKKIALITGANKGIGFEIARQLAQKDIHVFLASRDLKKGNEGINKLKAEGLNNVEAIQLDITDDASVERSSNRSRCESKDVGHPHK